jgi:hypothetical protein
MIVALYQAQTMRKQLEDDRKLDKESIAKAPEKFKTEASWKLFFKALETYLGQMLGSGCILLCYVISSQANPKPKGFFANNKQDHDQPTKKTISLWNNQVIGT